MSVDLGTKVSVGGLVFQVCLPLSSVVGARGWERSPCPLFSTRGPPSTPCPLRERPPSTPSHPSHGVKRIEEGSLSPAFRQSPPPPPSPCSPLHPSQGVKGWWRGPCSRPPSEPPPPLLPPTTCSRVPEDGRVRGLCPPSSVRGLSPSPNAKISGWMTGNDMSSAVLTNTEIFFFF